MHAAGRRSWAEGRVAEPAFDHLARTFIAIGVRRETRRLLGGSFGDPSVGSNAAGDSELAGTAVDALPPCLTTSAPHIADAATTYHRHAEFREASRRSLIPETELLRCGSA